MQIITMLADTLWNTQGHEMSAVLFIMCICLECMVTTVNLMNLVSALRIPLLFLQ